MARIIAVANQKGGVGKTTTTVNLAAAIAEQGKRTAIIDMDPQGNATTGLGVTPDEETPTVYDLILGDATYEETVMKDVFGCDLIPSGVDLAAAEVELIEKPEKEFILQRILEPVRDRYDFIFLDCPPSLNVLTVNAMTAADAVLVPIQCEYYALEGLGQLIQTVELVRDRLNPRLEIEGIVFTMFDVRTNLSAEVVENVKENVEQPIYQTIIPRSIRLAEAPSYGLPITEYESKSPGATAYRALAAEVIERNGEA